MSKLRIGLMLIFIAICTTLIPFADTDIRVTYNGSTMEVKPNPTIINGRTLVPLRSLMENFGSTVAWEPTDQSITIVRGNTTILLQIDNYVAEVNGRVITMDIAPKIINQRTYVPLRFISESLELSVQWDSKNQTVVITDGTPFFYEPVSIGSTSDTVIEQLGEPNRTDLSIYGFNWFIYNSDYKNYRQVGISNGKVVAQYGFDIEDISGGLLQPLMSRDEAVKILGNKLIYIKKGNTSYQVASSFQEVYKLNNLYYTCYYDASPKKRLYALSVIDAATEENFLAHYGKPSASLTLSNEREVLDIVNAYRALNALSPLKTSSALNGTAAAHSKDMATRQYFNHTSPDGKTLKDRLTAVFSTYKNSGENLAKGAPDARQAFNCWINSPGHLAIILGDYDQMGSGISMGSGSNIYYTLHLIKNGVLK